MRKLLLAIFALAGHSAFADISRIDVTGGAVSGHAEGGVVSFKGIPFAAPPVGELRWKAPQPIVPWEGTLDAADFGPGCMQSAGGSGGAGSNATAEDCLYLNVWTPAASGSERRPVLVWIYGGGFTSGRTSTPMYNGTHLAEQGIVVVSVAYRLGAFGFMGHPELSRESGVGSGTYGLQDMIAGLEWVRDNIAEFGGDPSRVTIFGHSAGGFAVSMLAASPRARGLFHGVISMSGGNFAPVMREGDEAGMRVPSLALAESNGERLLQQLGANGIAEARELSAESIQNRFEESGISFQPAADGHVIAGDQFLLYQQRRFNDTPVLIGSTSDEAASFRPPQVSTQDWEAGVRSNFGPAADALLAAYAHGNDEDTYRAVKGIRRETSFAWPTWTWARLQTRNGKNNAYVYFYDNHAEGADGAGHGSDVPFAFGTLDTRRSATPEDLALSDVISAYFVNFVIHGNPNGAGLPLWPEFSEANQQAMVFDGQPSARAMPNRDKLEAFDEYYAWRRAERE